MKEWLSVNWKPLVSVAALCALYALAKWFPGLEHERELLVAITEILGLGLIPLTPGLRATHRKDDPQ